MTHCAYFSIFLVISQHMGRVWICLLKFWLVSSSDRSCYKLPWCLHCISFPLVLHFRPSVIFVPYLGVFWGLSSFFSIFLPYLFSFFHFPFSPAILSSTGFQQGNWSGAEGTDLSHNWLQLTDVPSRQSLPVLWQQVRWSRKHISDDLQETQNVQTWRIQEIGLAPV